MWALYRKEIYSFLSSIIGIVVIGIFLAITSIFLWYADFGTNILQGGYANLDGLFALAPWVFLILIPAITMRSFAEEKNNGTFVLRTKYDQSIAEERIWFISENVRCRSSVLKTSEGSGILQTSFSSEVRRLTKS